MPEWTLEQIEQQAVKGGVNREQAEQLVASVRYLTARVEALQAQVERDDPLEVFKGNP